ncbi:MAG: methionyl-tRNA formyltransferase [Clostridia bacterium]|nr:methionyl-tRNA formyltransferase [Clostridia bacterium]
MKVIFMGTPDFAKESLQAIYEDGHEILAVVTNPDKPSGRGMKLKPSPVKEYAEEKGLKIYQPQKVRNNEEFINELKALEPEVICVVAYGKILPKEILEIPPKGCINVHGSLLPKYRGAAPIQWAVINGEKTTGITTMYMDIGMDTGDMILKQEVEIGEDETTGELWDRLSKIGGELLKETLKQIENGTAPRTKQGEDFSIAPMLDKEKDTKINWDEKTAIEIKNQVRGLNPIMGAVTNLNGKKIKFWKVQAVSENELAEIYVKNAAILGENPEGSVQDKIKNIQARQNGTVLIQNSKIGLYIKAKDGVLQVVEIQGENSKRMSAQDYLRGNKIEVGEIFK